MWLLVVLAHLVGLVGYNLLLRRSLTTKTDGWTLALVMQTGIALPAVVLAMVSPPDFTAYTWRDYLQIVVIAVLIALLHLTNVRGLRDLEVSVYTILFNLRIVLIAILGLAFLGESLMPWSIVGGLLIFSSIVVSNQQGQRHLTIRGIRWGLAAALVMSVLSANEKAIISRIGFLHYAVPTMILAAIVMWMSVIPRSRRVSMSMFTRPSMLALMGLRALSAYCFTLALALGASVSVANYLSSLGVVIIVILGVVLLGEREQLARKTLSAVLALLGLTAILVQQMG